MPRAPRRLVADFNYGGLVGDEGRVYFGADTLEAAEQIGIKLVEGQPLTVSDYDADESGRPTWLVAEGVVGHDPASDRWFVDYRRSELRWEPRAAEES